TQAPPSRCAAPHFPRVSARERGRRYPSLPAVVPRRLALYKRAARGRFGRAIGPRFRPKSSMEPRCMPRGKENNYRPSDKEPFMNEGQRDYFRQRLLAWRDEILREARDTLQHLQDENQNHPDLADRASSETDRAIELRARDRQRKLIAKIDAA